MRRGSNVAHFLSRRQLRTHSTRAAISPRDPPRHRLDLPALDTAVHYTREGPPLREARHVVCMWHGAPGSTFDWRYVAPCLSPDVAVLRLELPGHGESPRGAVLDADPAAMHRAVLAAIRGVAEAEGQPLRSSGAPPQQPVLEVFALAHSLGSLEALELCDPAAANANESTAVPIRFVGCALVSPFGLRPHRAIKQFAKRPDGETFPLLHLLMRSPLAEALLAPMVRLASVKLMGFGKRSSASELFWMVKRAAASDYGRVQAIYKRMADTKTPLFLCYGGRDPLMERAVHDEVAQLLGIDVHEYGDEIGDDGAARPIDKVSAMGGRRVFDSQQSLEATAEEVEEDGGAACRDVRVQRATVFVRATHYAIRSHAPQLAAQLEAWMHVVRSHDPRRPQDTGRHSQQ